MIDNKKKKKTKQNKMDRLPSFIGQSVQLQ